jgi:hypothetical protein
MIRERFPQTEPHLEAYVKLIDAIRTWLDGIVQMAITKMRDLSAG